MQTIRSLLVLVTLALAPFPLAAQITETHTFTTNRVVPDGNAAGLSDVRTISSAIANIGSVAVRLKVAGEFNGDLYAYVRHSSGFAVLLNRAGKTAANPAGYDDSGFDVTFRSGAANGDVHLYRGVSTPAPGAALTGTWQADGRTNDPANVTETSLRAAPLTSFNGVAASGEWTLYLADVESGGTNMLREWSLEITGPTPPALAWTNPATITYGSVLGSSQLNAVATYNSTNVNGTLAYTPALGSVLNVGAAQTLSVTFTPADTGSFLPVSTNVSINVLRAPLTITAVNTNKIYGAALPGFTATYSGFVNGDTSVNLDTPPSVTTTATSASSVGTYAITVGSATNANYDITFVSGTLTVTRASLTITAADKTKIYGAALPGLTATYTGFVNGDTSASLDTAPVLTTGATGTSSVGIYPITASSATDVNYNITFASGTLTVTRAPLTIAADDKTKAYGTALPPLTASYLGLVNGDTSANIDTPPILNAAATAASGAGTYAITAAGAVDANYTITHQSGTLTITQAIITVVADNKTKVYGAALPALTATYGGFISGEGANNLTTLAGLATAATASSSVGTYAITASGASSPNYTFNYASGTLTITQSLTVVAVGSSANPAVPGANVTFNATLTASSPGAGTPTGTVQFRIDGSVAGVGTLSGGTAAFALNTLALGSHTVSAEYPGGLNFAGSTNNLTPNQVINTPPVAGNDTIERYATQGTKVRLSTLLTNDSDADGDALTVTISPTSANGASIIFSNDWVCYIPPVGLTGADSFTYTIADGRGGSALATVTVAIKSDNDPGQNLVITALANGSFRIRGSGIPGRTYRLQYSDTFAPPNWQDLAGASVTADSSGAFEYIDTSGAPTRYYRSVCP